MGVMGALTLKAGWELEIKMKKEDVLDREASIQSPAQNGPADRRLALLALAVHSGYQELSDW